MKPICTGLVFMSSSRQLAAILFTDIAGYTAMMQTNEETALAVVRHYMMVLKETVGRYEGTIVNDYGDGNLCTFSSATDAVRCAVDLQRSLQSEPRVPLRVGLHIGEIFYEDEKVFGDGVNVASRIQSLGVANSILFSAEIQSKINNQPEFKSVSLGDFHFKNVTVPMEVFALANDGLTVPDRRNMDGKLKRFGNAPRRWMIAGVLIAMALGVLATWWYVNKMAISRKSVAVLAFQDLSPGKDHEWFSDGISEEILNSLAQLKELKVIAKTSSFYFKDKVLTFTEIAEKLGVDYIIEGSVRKDANNLRITVQLIDARDESHLFSETYNRSYLDLFDVQTDIAENIASKLLSSFTSQQQSKIKTEKPASVDAYEYFIRGKKMHIDVYSATHQDDHFVESRALLMKSISLDSTFAPAYAALADLYDSRGNDDRYKATFWRLRDSMSLVSYRINPNSSYVLLVRALTFSKSASNNLDSAFHYFRKAYALNSTDSYLMVMIGHFYAQLGLYDQAIEFYTKTLEFDPLNSSARAGLGTGLLYMGEFGAAEREYLRAIEVDSLTLPSLALLYIYDGRAEESIRGLQRHVSQLQQVFQAIRYAKAGSRKQALDLSRDIRVYMALGVKQETLRLLDSLTQKPIPLIDSKATNLLFSVHALEKSTLWDFVRDDPEFHRILERVRRTSAEKLKRYGSVL